MEGKVIHAFCELYGLWVVLWFSSSIQEHFVAICEVVLHLHYEHHRHLYMCLVSAAGCDQSTGIWCSFSFERFPKDALFRAFLLVLPLEQRFSSLSPNTPGLNLFARTKRTSRLRCDSIIDAFYEINNSMTLFHNNLSASVCFCTHISLFHLIDFLLVTIGMWFHYTHTLMYVYMYIYTHRYVCACVSNWCINWILIIVLHDAHKKQN